MSDRRPRTAWKRSSGRSSAWWLWSVGALFAAGFIVLAVLYALVGSGRVSSTIEERGPDGGAAVVISLNGVDAVGQKVTADIGLEAWNEAGETSYVLPETLEVLLSPLVGEQSVTFLGRTSLGTKPVQISSSGEIASWPFDRQVVARLSLVGCERRCLSDDRMTPTVVPLDVVVDGRVNGWEISARTLPADDPDGTRAVEITASRSMSTILFGAVLLALLVANAVVATAMTVRLFRQRWKFEPAFAGWMAGMLFAIVPLRGFLPGSPPVGSWIDYLVILWVVVALGVNMIVYVSVGTRAYPENGRRSDRATGTGG